MSDENEEFRRGLVAAVQAELERHATAVVAEVDRLRDEARRDREDLRAEIKALDDKLSAGVGASELKALEQRMSDSESRQTRRLDDVASSVQGLVSEATRPVVTDLRDEQADMVRRIEGLDGNLRKFDEQAARMVTYFNDVSQRVEARQDELSTTLRDDITSQITDLKRLVDDNDSVVRRFQNDVGQSVSQKVNDAEDRFNNRLLAAESRLKEDAGSQIAAIDAHVGRVSSGLDDTMTVLNGRISDLDGRIAALDESLEELRASVDGVDSSELDELKDKLSSAIGEATLVRIEMERFEKNAHEKSDELAVRITEVETQLQDATMDVSTAIQLDRLEEIERALIELDPDKFVLKDGESIAIPASNGVLPAPSGVPTPDSAPPPADEPVQNPVPAADESTGIDIAAIIAGAEGASTRDSNPTS